jgi:hypothetical protein
MMKSSTQNQRNVGYPEEHNTKDDADPNRNVPF